MPIDYTKRPAEPTAALSDNPVSLSKVTLTKAAPTVSLSKQGAAEGTLRVNLNWNARPPAQGGGLLKRLSAAAQPGIDLDLGCLYEFTDGSKGVVQALGNAFTAAPKGSNERVIWLDGDDRSGTNTAGENLFVDLRHVNQIRRIMVFAFIYEGVPNWAEAAGVVTLFPASGPQVEVHLDETRAGARICGVALLSGDGKGDLTVRREVNYIDGGQSALDKAYGWGMNWAPGRK